MKKSLALLLAIAVMLVAAGCGKKAIEGGDTGNKPVASNPGTTTPSNPANPGSTPAPEPKQTFLPPEPKPAFERVNLGDLKVPSEAKIGPLTVKVEERAIVTKTAGLPPNYYYLVMKVTIVNGGKDEYTINTTDHFKMETPEAKLMPFNVQATAQRSPRLQGTLEGGKSQTGWLGYMVKVQPGNFKFRFTHPDWGDLFWSFPIQ
ncbi:MAG TPA: DUF4352 domain-containing protein [Symbiobacteriaceae bacterium]|nr:DUF4352 domain-containing protein [Symbiobacteriaceae bacterium]